MDLLSFTATGAKKTISVHWETASEIDNLGFACTAPRRKMVRGRSSTRS
jgi:hypothetical protein